MARLAFLTFLLNAFLVALMVPGDASLPWIAAETLVLAGLFLWLPDRWLRLGLARGVGLLYGVSALFVMLDGLVRMSLGRPLNLYLDVSIIRASVDLLVSNLGIPGTVMVCALGLLLCLALAALVSRLLLGIGELGPQVARRPLALGLTLVVMAGLVVPVPLVGATAIRIGASQADHVMDARQASRQFREQLSLRRDMSAMDGVALEGLSSTTVVLAFVESYGVSALMDDRYRPTVAASLERLGQVAEERGFHVVSGRLRSPVQGGQSWLAHGTLLSGLWIDSQQDYDALLASGSATLIDDFRRTGHESVAVMPAITLAWPEGRALGYDRILDADSMGYLGPNLNWVTMPDQYTWSRMHDVVLGDSGGPVFAELSLISSHAPWVPVLPVLEDWQSIGRGEVFEPWRQAGEAPASLWQDPDRVRQHYARAISYSIDVIAGYLENRMNDRTLLVIMGDHQPAPLVTGERASRDVPVHLISADQGLLEPFAGTAGQEGGLVGFRGGIWPDVGQEGPTMDRFRPFLHRHFRARGNLSHP
ncbi:hypothetical protein ACJO2E_03675 [Marinobacter sp. M1N3S26]|uniref:hypothetical protein n=1 Tax=Marinobacter sp. M1N3S26 TaxID=3382299 RepID=UPI00387AAE44